VVESDGVDDVCISVNSSPSKVINCNATFNNGLPVVSSSVLCAKASMLLQVNFTLQLEFLFIFTLSEHSAFFLHEFYCYLLGCFSASTPALYAGTAVAVG